VVLKDGQPAVTFSVMLKKADFGVAALADQIVEAVPKQYDNARILAHEKVTIGGFECAKVEYVVTGDGRQFSKLFYVLPVGSARAMMSLDGTTDDVARVRPAFDSSVRRVSGLAQPSDPHQSGKMLAASGLLILIGAAIFQRLRNKKKRRGAA